VKFISVAGTDKPEPSLLVDTGATIGGNSDCTPDSLIFDVRATFTLNGQVQKVGTGGGGLFRFTVEPGAPAN
jgi:hypothetical protein